jgi:hypothetical protein
MNEARESDQIRLFIKRYAGIGLFSTGAELVDFTDVLYNVTGSTHDPREVPENEGMTWKKLLINLADLAEADCYVTNDAPNKESSHPDFSVGGHMTPNSTGVVAVGGTSYLMPLCKWHNSTSRDGVAFEHTETKMLKLTGFMEGDSAVTFALRLPAEEPYSLLYLDRTKGLWEYSNFSEEKALALNAKLLSATEDSAEPVQEYVLFERRDNRYYVVSTNLSY